MLAIGGTLDAELPSGRTGTYPRVLRWENDNWSESVLPDELVRALLLPPEYDGFNGRNGDTMRRNSRFAATLSAAIVLSHLTAGATAASADVSPSVVADTGSSNKLKIRPETIVRFAKGGPVCLDKSDLQELIVRSLRGEETRANAMLVEHSGGCVMLSPTERYKVISVDGVDDADLGLLEIVGEGIVSGRGAWAVAL